jgi:hypothetical protein
MRFLDRGENRRLKSELGCREKKPEKRERKKRMKRMKRKKNPPYPAKKKAVFDRVPL